MSNCDRYEKGTGNYLACDYGQQSATVPVIAGVLSAVIVIIVLWQAYKRWYWKKQEKMWEEWLKEQDKKVEEKKKSDKK